MNIFPQPVCELINHYLIVLIGKNDSLFDKEQFRKFQEIWKEIKDDTYEFDYDVDSDISLFEACDDGHIILGIAEKVRYVKTQYPLSPEDRLRIMGINYNVLRIMSGFGGLHY